MTIDGGGGDGSRCHALSVHGDANNLKILADMPETPKNDSNAPYSENDLKTAKITSKNVRKCQVRPKR